MFEGLDFTKALSESQGAASNFSFPTSSPAFDAWLEAYGKEGAPLANYNIPSGSGGGPSGGGGGDFSFAKQLGEFALSKVAEKAIAPYLPSLGSIGTTLFGTAGGTGAAIGAAHAAGVAAVPGGVSTAGTSGLLGSGGSFLGLGSVAGPLALGALALGAGALLSGAFKKESKRGATAGAGYYIDPQTGQFKYQIGVDNGGDPESIRSEAERGLAILEALRQASGRNLTQQDLRDAVLKISPDGQTWVERGTIATAGVGGFAKGGFRSAEDMARDLVRGGLFGDPNDPKLLAILYGLGLATDEQARAYEAEVQRAAAARQAALDELLGQAKALREGVMGVDLADEETLRRFLEEARAGRGRADVFGEQSVIDAFKEAIAASEGRLGELSQKRADLESEVAGLRDAFLAARDYINPDAVADRMAQLDALRDALIKFRVTGAKDEFDAAVAKLAAEQARLDEEAGIKSRDLAWRQALVNLFSPTNPAMPGYMDSDVRFRVPVRNRRGDIEWIDPYSFANLL